ncbi:MAG TPA: AAA family ATPase [Pseudonocardiaceae bacterium]|nr:AAA family ATPase [Pseudonocardiaceae bacterium]
MKGYELVGRDTELAALAGPVDPARPGQVLVLLGDAGTGKTALLDVVADRVTERGLRVLRAAATKAELDVPFAGLHLLFHPVLDALDALPPLHRDALLTAFGLAKGESADRLVEGMATVALAREFQPLLLIVDDVQWLDASSRAALTFACRRLAGAAVSVVFAGRGAKAPEGLGRTVAELRLGPLSERDAALLVDRQPIPPRGLVRDRVLAEGAGNPAALIELSAVVANRPSASSWAHDLLPLTPGLAAIYADELAELPDATRSALLLVSAVDPEDLEFASQRLPCASPEALAGAELAGLLRIGPGGIEFAHPLVRSAVYHSAPFAARAEAHRKLAEILAERPDRRALHLVRATLTPDEDVAALAESSIDEVRRRSGVAAATALMARAAELSPRDQDKARRLVLAADLARQVGNPSWSEDLANRAAEFAEDPEHRLAAQVQLGTALVWTSQHKAALELLLPLFQGSALAGPNLPWSALRGISAAAYLDGSDAARQQVRAALTALADRSGHRAEDLTDPIDLTMAWGAAALDPYHHRELAVAARATAERPLDTLPRTPLGAILWLLDESDVAVSVLRSSIDQLRNTQQGGSIGILLSHCWACADAGRWDEALDASAYLAGVAANTDQPLVRTIAELVIATVHGWRGEVDLARRYLSGPLDSGDPADCRAVGAWAYRAAGILALAEDEPATAYAHLRRLFADDGTPLHYHLSYQGIADLASIAVRLDLVTETRALVRRIVARFDGTPSSRVAQLLGHAEAVLAEPADAEAKFAEALAVPDGRRWPFEQARLRLAHAEWLRRQRRINEAKPVLSQVRDVFARLRASTWAERAERELRAAGVRVSESSAIEVGELSPQEHQVVHLAGQGLSNRQIGELLNLSPRTVGAHLYRAFPKLGITNRRQIRDVPAPVKSFD